MSADRITVDHAALALAAAGAPPLTEWQREVLRRILTPVAPAATNKRVTPIRRRDLVDVMNEVAA